ncbi:MAG TPA: polyprenyl synthetase family protein [Acidimicrobiales bacterium]
MDQGSSTTAPVLDGQLDVDRLAVMFGIPDLADRLAAVDERITSALGERDALLGPASVRVAGAGGKRLRPLFTIACAALGDVFDERVVAAAASVELVQIGSLVHDDIIDVAATRRGRPTINAHEGLDHALLAGDYILARAAEQAASLSQEAASLVAEALTQLCEGQVLELRDAFDPDRSLDAHLASIRGKTAALFECACRLGAHTGGLAPHNATAAARFGAAFGMSFQVLDDVLDLIGDADRLGKPTGIDIAAGVYTLPVITALRGPRGAELRGVLPGPRGDQGGTGNAGDVAAALTVVRGSGSVAGALATVDRYADEARRAVAHLNQANVGEGLWAFPRTYTTWALETLMDRRYLEVPLTAEPQA